MSWIFRDKTKNDNFSNIQIILHEITTLVDEKIMYNPKDDTQNNLFCRL